MTKFIPTPTNPGFGIIAPIQYLTTVAIKSRFHLVLAHLLESNRQYVDFYRECSDRGDFIICDNSAFELGQSYDPDKLIELAHKCKADVIVLPDYPGQHIDKTIEAAIKYAPLFKRAGFKTMFVPQSEVGNTEGWIESYTWASLDNDLVDVIGMSILGIPNALPQVHRAYARVVMTSMLKAQNVFNANKHHHYLGLNSGPNLEIPSLINMGALSSCDSSGPVWAGICGSEYSLNTDSFMTTSKIAKHVDFNYPLTTNANVIRMIQRNVDMTLDLFK